MKILIIRNYPSYMDVERNTYNIQEVGLAKALVRMGNVCDIVFWTDKEEKEVDIPADDYGTVHVFYKIGKTALKNVVYTNCNELFDKYDILQTAEYNQMESWLLAKRYPEKTIIYHGPYYSPFNRRYNLMCSLFDKVFLKRYLKLGTKFIVKSKLARDFLKSKGIKESNISTIGVGIDTQMLSDKESFCDEPLYLAMKKDKGLKLLYIGRFEERRNIPFVLDTFSTVIQKNCNTTLYMIGTGDSDYLESCWEHAEKLKIRNQIVYQERIEQRFLAEIYKLADFFLLPTAYEIFGMVLLEAMYYGVVVITTDNGGSGVLIENNTSGYIENTLDVNSWANLILNTYDDKTKMELIRKNSKKRIASYFTWDKLSPEFENAYTQLIYGKDRD